MHRLFISTTSNGKIISYEYPNFNISCLFASIRKTGFIYYRNGDYDITKILLIEGLTTSNIILYQIDL
ncbi:hypothetical protein EUGRSUZ_K00038 [Eucalyptus grandis]|uniref:Uncharacterized protein n=2 Tax=Eucalyptus grandis TaxID=71139 RepID=A0ACC3IQQ7_EUCGR|nr:hypothetical protein EUGRSUZ_K00038 [Eucalyptus grandis]